MSSYHYMGRLETTLAFSPSFDGRVPPYGTRGEAVEWLRKALSVSKLRGALPGHPQHLGNLGDPCQPHCSSSVSGARDSRSLRASSNLAIAVFSQRRAASGLSSTLTYAPLTASRPLRRFCFVVMQIFNHMHLTVSIYMRRRSRWVTWNPKQNHTDREPDHLVITPAPT